MRRDEITIDNQSYKEIKNSAKKCTAA